MKDFREENKIIKDKPLFHYLLLCSECLGNDSYSSLIYVGVLRKEELGVSLDAGREEIKVCMSTDYSGRGESLSRRVVNSPYQYERIVSSTLTSYLISDSEHVSLLSSL